MSVIFAPCSGFFLYRSGYFSSVPGAGGFGGLPRGNLSTSVTVSLFFKFVRSRSSRVGEGERLRERLCVKREGEREKDRLPREKDRPPREKLCI